MSTAQRDSDVSNETGWKISNKALEKLQCFMKGFDDVVIRIALDIASKRMGDEDSVINVESSDVDRAARLFMEYARSQATNLGISLSEINMMSECIQSKDTTPK